MLVLADQNIRVVSPTLAAVISDRVFLFLLLSGLFLFVAVLVPYTDANKILLGAGIGMLGMALFGTALQAVEWLGRMREDSQARCALLEEHRPAAVSDLSGRLVGGVLSAGRFPAAPPSQVIPGLLENTLEIDRRLASRLASRAAQEGRVEKHARIPNSVFLPKPFSLRQLKTVVDQQFR